MKIPENNLETYVNENLNAFDTEKPSGDFWLKIESKLPSQPSGNNNIWKWAAIFLGGVVLYQFFFFQNEAERNLEEGVTTEQVIFGEVETHYIKLIQLKQEEFDLLQEQNPAKWKALKQDLENLDALYTELKETFEETGYDERVMNAMIQNLQIRLTILNQQIEIINKINKLQDETKKYNPT